MELTDGKQERIKLHNMGMLFYVTLDKNLHWNGHKCFRYANAIALQERQQDLCIALVRTDGACYRVADGQCAGPLVNEAGKLHYVCLSARPKPQRVAIKRSITTPRRHLVQIKNLRTHWGYTEKED